MTELFQTPVLFLIFNRPDVTRIVFEKIKNIKPQYLFIAADGPRTHIPGEKEKCAETRVIINEIDWECELKTLFRDQNLGCGKAVSSAITWFFDHVEEGIILEDDCLPDISFFYYCNELLEKYRFYERIHFIGGCNFQNGINRGTGSYYFSNYNHIWGWATWKRVWEKYDFAMNDLAETLKETKLDHVFHNHHEKKYWTKIFLSTKSGKINTWDYQLTYVIWKNHGVSITPNINLVKNIGFTDNPTHNFLYDSRKSNSISGTIAIPLTNTDIIIDKKADVLTFENLYSHSFRRKLRLLKENGVCRIIKYLIR